MKYLQKNDHLRSTSLPNLTRKLRRIANWSDSRPRLEPCDRQTKHVCSSTDSFLANNLKSFSE
jgi:hypothetical protein